MMQLGEIPSSAKTITKNPLGIIALFIFLIYSIASLVLGVSTGSLTETQIWVFVVFLVIFPLLVLCIFVWLVVNHAEKLYSPMDFRDDKSYMELNKKIREVEVKQKAAQVDPRGNIHSASEVLEESLQLNQFKNAKSIAKAFLKVGRYSDSLELFNKISDFLNTQKPHKIEITAYKAYCLIGLKKYESAKELLYKLRTDSTDEFDFWPRMALAFCLWKEGERENSTDLLRQAALDESANSNASEVKRLYPEISEEFKSILENT